MKVLSLFDGMACGIIAMQLAGVEIESYDAYEIDKYAIKTAQHNFPMIKEHGDVFVADFTRYDGVDFLIGGSPCTYWSIAQTKNRETVASGMGWELFSQYVRALHEAKPKYFIYENNKSMSKAIRASIDETFGFEAVLINSALVSAQNRQRLYWVGKRNDDGTYSKVLVSQPEDRGILLRDILENSTVWQEKSYCLAADRGGHSLAHDIVKSKYTYAAEPVFKCLSDKEMEYMVRETKDGRNHFDFEYFHDGNKEKSSCVTANTHKGVPYNVLAEPIEPRCVAQRGRYPENPKSRVAGLPTEQMFEAREDVKTNTLTTVQKDNLVAEPVNITQDGKAQCLRATYYKDGIRNMVGNDVDRKTCVAEPVRIGTYPTSDGRLPNSQGNRIYSVDGKAVTQSAQGGGWGAKTGLYAVPTVEIGSKTHPVYEVSNGLITIKGKQYPIKLQDGYYIIRKLTVRECMRLQTVPEWYEFPVSDSQAYKMLGNGWTCEVIAHLIRSAMAQHIQIE